MVRNFGLTRSHFTFLFAGKNDNKDLFDILDLNKLNAHFKELMLASQLKEFNVILQVASCPNLKLMRK
ncbi:hypothetical protein MKX03_001847 [Papaver bracteatum]|nr:hypothetical protein MKX03_001847 [Papaver bracteatum]